MSFLLHVASIICNPPLEGYWGLCHYYQKIVWLLQSPVKVLQLLCRSYQEIHTPLKGVA